jgi:hypothetical protein
VYTVKVCRDGDELAGPMAQMRTWLDSKGIEPILFRMLLTRAATIFLIEFRTAPEARAFARALGGTVVLKPDRQLHAA